MTISMEAFLMIVIPELFLFFVWCFFCISSMKTTMGEVKKKKKPLILRELGDNYPFEKGESLPYVDF